mmetsp:Transcript_20817/g.34031  ORF Transcript_20817/g.34031 Transcript_20817/m.34031 type:complete len:175 (-) Transcript_20817:64-588(-)
MEQAKLDPPTLQTLCEECLKNSLRLNQDLLAATVFARDLNRFKLEEELKEKIVKNYRFLRQRAGTADLLVQVLGESKCTALDESIHQLEKTKTTFAKLRTGTIKEKTVVDNQPDEDGNYPYESLVSGVAWPADVDPTRREMRLENEKFRQLFQMDKEDFKKLPQFVRIRQKKAL